MRAQELLSDFPVYNPPERLFRFHQPIGLPALTEGTLKITPPKDLNDPFEMWVGISTADLTEESILRSAFSERGLFRQSLRKHVAGKIFNEAGYNDVLRQTIREKPELWPDHLRTLTGSIIQTLSSNMGVCSFSAFSETELCGEIGIRHWAVYGDFHRGFAIEYFGRHQIFADLASQKWFFPIDYKSSRLLVDISEFDEWDDKLLWSTIRKWAANKCKLAWGDEHEWRFIFPIVTDGSMRVVNTQNGPIYVIPFWGTQDPEPKRMATAKVIKRVYLGLKASDALKSDIKAALRASHFSHVELFQAERCEMNYSLIYKIVSKD